MDAKTQELMERRLSWWRFIVIALLVCLPVALIWVLAGPATHRPASRLVPPVMAVCIIVNMAYRWRWLRSEAAAGRLSWDDVRRDPQFYFVGSPRHRYILVGVMVTLMVLVVLIGMPVKPWN